jgi:hypothetical protein
LGEEFVKISGEGIVPGSERGFSVGFGAALCGSLVMKFCGIGPRHGKTLVPYSGVRFLCWDLLASRNGSPEACS